MLNNNFDTNQNENENVNENENEINEEKINIHIDSTSQNNSQDINRNTKPIDPKIKEAFLLFDQNDDGILDKDELITLLRALGKYVTENDVDNLIRDTNSNIIDINKFILILNTIAPKNTEKDLREAFELFDSDNNGYILVSEFKHILTNLGEKLSSDVIDDIINQLDINNEGKIYKTIFLTTLLQ